MASAVLSEVVSSSPGSRLPCTPVNFVSPVLRRRGLLEGGVSAKKSPLAQTSTTNTMLEINDDEAEKRERRLSKALEMQQQLLVSPVVQSDRSQHAVTSVIYTACSVLMSSVAIKPWFSLCLYYYGKFMRLFFVLQAHEYYFVPLVLVVSSSASDCLECLVSG